MLRFVKGIGFVRVSSERGVKIFVWSCKFIMSCKNEDQRNLVPSGLHVIYVM